MQLRARERTNGALRLRDLSMEAEKSATSLDGLFELLDESRFRTMDLFEMLDTDRSGTVEMQELHNTLCGPLGIEVTESDTRRLFEMLDVDSSGSVSIAEFLKRMRQAQLQRRAAAKAEARRKVIEARKLGRKEAELAAATKERMQAFEKLGRVDTRPRSEKADEALLRIMAYLEKNKLKMVDVFSALAFCHFPPGRDSLLTGWLAAAQIRWTRTTPATSTRKRWR